MPRKLPRDLPRDLPRKLPRELPRASAELPRRAAGIWPPSLMKDVCAAVAELNDADLPAICKETPAPTAATL